MCLHTSSKVNFGQTPFVSTISHMRSSSPKAFFRSHVVLCSSPVTNDTAQRDFSAVYLVLQLSSTVWRHTAQEAVGRGQAIGRREECRWSSEGEIEVRARSCVRRWSMERTVGRETHWNSGRGGVGGATVKCKTSASGYITVPSAADESASQQAWQIPGVERE